MGNTSLGVTREGGWRSTGNNWRLRSEVIRRQQATVRHYLLTSLFRGHCRKKYKAPHTLKNLRNASSPGEKRLDHTQEVQTLCHFNFQSPRFFGDS